MKVKYSDLIIYCFILYLIIGIVMLIIYPDKQVLSAVELQEKVNMSVVGSYVLIAIRSVISILFWPMQVLVLLT